MEPSYTIVDEKIVNTVTGGLSERKLFSVNGELFMTSRVFKGTPEDVTAIFPALPVIDIDWNRYMDEGFDFVEFPGVDHESAIEQWLDQL